jgi:hypothetical protein
MKNLLQFLTEAGTSKASEQAKKLNLKSDGHGSWFDSRGKLVAVTDKGRLKFTSKKKSAADESPAQVMGQRRRDDDLAGSPLQRKPAPKAKAKAKPEPEKQKGEGDTLTTAFGRFNPPTAGHGKLLAAAKKAAAGGDLKIYPSRTQDPKKNPLDPDMKVSYMRKMFPEYEEQIVNDAEMKSIFDVLITAASDGYKNVNIIVGADRQSEFENLAQKYNGDLYDFDEIRVISAGVRDADAEGVEGMSASKLRKSVVDDDFKAFKKGLPKINDGEAMALFNAVRIGMKIKAAAKVKEEFADWQIAPRYDKQMLREKYVTKKIFNIGDLVENLNTGLVGRIIRRGTNYLICVTEQDNMFKSWIRDVMEAVKSEEKTQKYGDDSIYRAPGKPNTLVGTTGYLKNAMKAMGVKEIKGFINKNKAKK